MINKIDSQTLRRLISNGTNNDFSQITKLFNDLADQTSVIESSGAPTIQALKHSWYFDTAASKYYRNTDGGTTWVALN